MSVRMTHPDLPGQEYVAEEIQVPHLRATGWVADPAQAARVEEWPAEAQRFEGQEQVTIRHPETGGEAVVAASAVPFHRERGWEVVEAPAAAAAEPAAEAEDAGEPAAGEDPRTVEDLKAEIRALNEDRGPDDRLPVSGTKAELLARLREAQEQTGDEGEA